MSEYTYESIEAIVTKQRAFFKTGATLPVSWRIEQLKKLRQMVTDHEAEFEEALNLDLGRTQTEAYLIELGPIILEINELIAGLKKWARPERHFSGIMCFPSLITTVYKMPYGVSLIISPYNFPLMLSLSVAAAEIAGGNTCLIKASSKTPACTAATKKILAETFPEEFLTVIDGGHDVADLCLSQRVDKIFYTGSPKVARHVLAKASENLIPCTLELAARPATGAW